MANWTKPRRLIDVKQYRGELIQQYGVYELGIMYGGQFKERYLGRARSGSSCLYGRLTSYISEGRCHNIHLRARIEQELHNKVWFRISRVGNPAFTEARLLHTHEIRRHKGLYQWNERYEYQAFRDEGWDVF